MQRIKINEKDYTIKATFRAMLLVEQKTGKPFTLEPTYTDLINYGYAVLKVNNPDFDYSFEDFVGILDEDPAIFNELVAKITDEWTGNQGNAQGKGDGQKKR